MNIIGIDFGITKPAACVQTSTGELIYFGWPRPDSISTKRIKIYKDANVNIGLRNDTSNSEKNSSAKMNFAVSNSSYLADVIINDIKSFLNKDTIIAYEGLSFGSTGDAILQLSGYKYILMNELSKLVPLSNMYTYAPITIKKTAGCSKRGLVKKDVINSFLKTEKTLAPIVNSNIELFMKKGMKNYIELLDDLVDAYWTVITCKNKEKLFS